MKTKQVFARLEDAVGPCMRATCCIVEVWLNHACMSAAAKSSQFLWRFVLVG